MLKVPALHFYKAKDRGTLQRQAGPTLFPKAIHARYQPRTTFHGSWISDVITYKLPEPQHSLRILNLELKSA